ncbi:MAG TPA: flippase, partial [Gemmatimonadaceae bacterium]|nr:flippase [Gemmatimonadaceae bacterium]
MTSSRLLARNTLLNTGAQLVPMVAAFVAIPILIRSLGADRFGVLTLAWAVIGYFSLFDLGLSRALTHAVALRLGREEDGTDLPEVVWTSMALMFVLGVVGGVVLAALARWVVGHGLNVPAELVDESRKTLYLLALSMPLIVTTAGFRGLLEAHQHFGASVALRVPLGVFSFVGPLLVLPFSHALPPIVALLVVGRALTFLAHLIVCLRRYPFLRERLALRASAVLPLLRIGGWMTTTNVISPLMNYLDRFFVGAILPMAAVAHYVTPYELVSKLSLFPQSLMGVFFPAFASSFVSDRERTAALFGRSLRGLLLFMFPLALVLVLFAREGLTLWVGAAFAAASAPVLRWLAVGIFINAMA